MAREFVTSNGVKLQIRPVSALVVIAVQQALKKPKPPTIRIEGKARDEENPNDPEYVQQLEDYNIKLSLLTTDTYLANGIKVIELPEDVAPLESDSWIEGLEIVGLTVPHEGLARKIAWLRWHVLPDSDVARLIGEIAVAGGVVTEEQVAQAADTFRDNTNGHSDTPIQIESNGGIGNTTINSTGFGD